MYFVSFIRGLSLWIFFEIAKRFLKFRGDLKIIPPLQMKRGLRGCLILRKVKHLFDSPLYLKRREKE